MHVSPWRPYRRHSNGALRLNKGTEMVGKKVVFLAVAVVAMILTSTWPTTPASASNPAVSIVSSTTWSDAGYRYTVGEVRNDSTEVANSIEINASYFNSSNVLVDTHSTYADVMPLLPSEKAPFRLVIQELTTFGHVTLSASANELGNWENFPNRQFTAAITSTMTDTIGFERIVGTVRNDNSVPAAWVTIVISFYDAAGQIVDTSRAFINGGGSRIEIPGGQEATFAVTRFHETPTYVSRSIQIDADVEVPPTPPTTTTFTSTITTPATTPPTSTRPPVVRENPARNNALESTEQRTVNGYWMVTSDGSVYAFGDVAHHGNASTNDAIDLEAHPSGDGYWVANASGRVYAFGAATHHGDSPSLASNERVASISTTKSGNGYWLFTSAGRVFTYGDAMHRGDMSGTRLNGPVLDSVATPSGDGYYMVASDGGVFTFGDAAFHGSMGGQSLNQPVQSLVPDGDGTGYWLVASDGGIFAFEAAFYGSMGGTRLNKPVTGMVGSTGGYLMVAEDGGIFSFGSTPFFGSLGSSPPAKPVTSVAVH
jgi:hypothetical protein